MIVNSPFPPVTIPDCSLTEFVFRRAEEFADKAALIEGPTGRVVTYSQLVQSVRRVAASLHARGFRKGHVFGIMSPNLPEYAMLFHGVALIGGILTPINPLYTDSEIAHQLKDAGAKFLITVPQCLDKARAAASEASVEEIFVFGEAEGSTSFSSLVAEDGEVPIVEINPREDLIALPYSSGTTGLPKGVMLTHHNLVANLCQMEGLDYFSQDDTLICVLPLFHIYGLVVILNMGLHKGSTIVTMPRFDLEQFLKAVQDYRVTMAHIVPPIVLALSNSPLVEQYDLSSLHTLFSGAAPLGESLTKTCMQRLNCKIRQGYGMTETSPVTHSSPSDASRVKFGSVGLVAPNTECKVVDLESGTPQPARKEGEICVRGPQVMKGYLNKPEATSSTIDSDGWLHTGDVGFVDEDGHFFVVDRAKELIKYKGFQVAPAELESILLTHPAIADAAVIPYPDDEAGEVPKAYVVRTADVSAAAIMDYLAAEVAPFKKLRFVEFIDKIPKSPSGKILRRGFVAQD